MAPNPGPVHAPDVPDLETALRATAAVREFTDRPVTRTEIARVLDVARFAPSGGNQQPWHVVSVEDPAIRAGLGTLIVDTAKEYLALGRAGVRAFGLSDHGRWPGPGDVDLAAARAADLGVPAFEHLADAPALLAVLVDLGRLAAMDAELDRHGVVAGASIYPFCWQILLAARLHGLGGVITTFAVRREPEALALLGAPDGWALAAVIALGEPVHQPTRLRRHAVARFATVDQFTGPRLVTPDVVSGVMDPNVLGLEGKRSLVLGGGYGIGRESALLLARAGAPVVVADLDQARADAVAAELADLGVASHALSADVTDKERAVAIVDEAAAFHGGLDVMINMIGFAAWGNLFELDDDTWELDLSRNLRHHLWTAKAAARHMIDQDTGGAIAMVASVSGIYGAPNHAAYGAAKAGVMSLTRTMAQEWGRNGIRVNAVAPDMIATPRMKAQQAHFTEDPDERARASIQPLGRMGEADEIAGPLVFLCSDLASFVTGQTLIVDGGTFAAFPHFGATEKM